MKTRIRGLFLACVIAIVMLFGALAITPLTARADGASYVDFKITDESGVAFTGNSSGFQRVQLTTGDKTPTLLPDLMRTDSLDYEFDGWYYGNTRVTLDTEFDDYAVIYDRWNEVSYDSAKVVSGVSLAPALPGEGMTQDAYKAACTEISQTGLWVSSGEEYTLYEGLNAKSGNELTGTVRANENYSAKITLRVDYGNGYRIGTTFMDGVTSANGIVSDVSYFGSNGAKSDSWTSDVRLVKVVINFTYNDFVSYPKSSYVENGKEFVAAFETTYPFTKAILQHKTGYSTWNDLYVMKSASKGEFVLPAFVDTTETFCIYTLFPDGQVKLGKEFTVVYGSGNSDEKGKFVVQPPTTVDLALNEEYVVQYMFNRGFSNMWLDIWKGYWAEKTSFHNNGVMTITGRDHATSITYRIGVSYEYKGEYYVEYSDNFTLNWIDNAESWTVSFMANGGIGTMADIPNVSGDFVVPECGYTAPVGKEFEEWVCDGVRYKPGDHINITRARLFVALWKPVIKDAYDITFKANGGSGSMELMLAKYEEQFVAPECAFTAPAGKKFAAWWVNGQTYYAGDTLTVKKDTEFVASWVDDVFTVSFDANGGSGEMSAVAEAPASYTLPSCAFDAPGGKHFIGWAVGSTSATPVAAASKVKLTQNTTLYAIWDDNEPMTITYDDGTGTGTAVYFALPEGAQFSVATYDSLGFVAPAGKRFSHWKEIWTGTDNVAENSSYTVPDDYVYFRAVLVSTGESVYTVQFSGSGQTGDMETLEVVEGTELVIPMPEYTAPAGTEFVGWALNGDVTKVKKPLDVITVNGNIDLAAMWRTPVGITAEYGGRVLAGGYIDVSKVFVYLNYDDEYKELLPASSVYYFINDVPIPKIGECKFVAAGVYEITVSYGSYEDTTMGVIVANRYLVTFDGNGGKGSIEEQEVYTTEYTLPENKFVAPAGKVFKGWKVNDAEYAPGQTVALSGDVTVAAVWESIYAVLFNANGGSGEMPTVEHIGAYTLPSCGFTAPAGKIFKGWAVSADGEVIDGASYSVSADVEFFAVWEDAPNTNPDNTPDNTPEDIPEEKPEGLSGGAIAGIVVGGVVVLGFGGFAIFWFVIKKKSFADLIAIFRR